MVYDDRVWIRMTEYGSGRQWALIAVVRVDVEAEDGVDVHGLSAARGGAEFPAWQRGHDFRGHNCGSGLEDLQIFQVAGCVQFAFDDYAGAGKVCREIGAQAFGSSESSGAGMRGGIGFGELHDDSADVGVDVDGVVVAGKLAVEIKRAAGTRCRDDGDCRPRIAFHRRAARNAGSVAVTGVEAGKIDHGAAAANVYACRSRIARGRGAGAAWAGCGRDSGASIRVGAATSAGFSRACAFPG